MKFAALNKEISSSSTHSTPSGKKGRPTVEAQESACLQLYHSAMRLQQDGDLMQAKELYREILDSEVMEEACQVGGASEVSTIVKLKYLVYKNIAGIAREQGDLSAAVDAYIEASTVDASDVTMWCQLASAASLLGNLLLARKSLEHALSCNEQYWPALESLCTVLFALGDFHACLFAVEKGLELDPDFPRGLVYLNHIVQHCPDLLDNQLAHLRIHLMKPLSSGGDVFLCEASEMSARRDSLHNVTVLPEMIVPTKKLASLTIYNLASCLLALYRHCKELSQKKPSFTTRVDVSLLYNGADEATPTITSSPVKKVTIVEELGGSTKHVGGSPKRVGGSPKHVTDPGGASSSGDESGGSRRDPKRRLLDELEPFAPKRRSTRVRAKSTTCTIHPHQNYFEMLSKYIPCWLKMPELPDLSDFSPLRKPKEDADKQSLQKRQRQVAALLDSTHHLDEGEVVKTFLVKNKDNSGILNLLNQFILFLALRYDHKWAAAPFPVIKLFVELFECLHTHLTYPSPFRSMEEAQQIGFKNMAMAALCYIELYVDCTSSRKGLSGLSGSKRLGFSESSSLGASISNHPKSFRESILFVKQCAGLVGASERERVQFALRVFWCLGKLNVLNKNTDEATHSVKQCEQMLQAAAQLPSDEKPSVVCLPNILVDQLITIDHVRDKLKQLEQCVSFKHIHDLFVSCEYSPVVDKLLPILEQDSGPPLEFLVGGGKSSSEEKTSLSLLLTSLLHLQRYHTCLQTALQALLSLIAHSRPGNERWAAALKETFLVIDRCLPQAETGGTKDSVDGHFTDSMNKGRQSKDISEQICGKVDKGKQISDKMDKSEQTGNYVDKGEQNTDKENKSEQLSILEEKCTREDLLERCDARLLKRLVACVVKTMDLVADMTDSPTHHCLPIAVTWKIFYTVIASKWRAAADVVTYQSPLTSPLYTKQPCDEEHPLPPASAESNDLNEPMDTSPEVCQPTSTLVVVSISPPELPVDIKTSPPLSRDLQPVATKSPASSSTHSSSVPSEETVELVPSLRFLIEAHDHLGRNGLCCKDDGCFLKASVASLRSELKLLTKLPQKLRQTLLVQLEQCYYCLFGHPQKKAKARGLSDHKSSQIPLTWESALMLIEYFHPSPLPSIDDSKSPQVTMELVSLYKRIVDVVPAYGRVISQEDLSGFIDGTCTESMMVLVTPHQHSSTISELYYLLADDALKGGDNHKAIRYYLSNLCYCPDWFDSWAGLALARSRKIVERLNTRDFRSGMERYVQKQTSATVRCFEKAVSLNSKHCYIVEKFGFFCYAIQSFTSQILNQPDLFLLKDIHTWASESLGEMLLLARKCFSQALSLGVSKHSEPWLYQLMLGKIGRKLTRPLKETLEFFVNSSEVLCSDGASYPDYVELTAKHHAVEAIEVHYQLHACILKSLLEKGNTPVKETNNPLVLTQRSVLEEGIQALFVRLEALPLGCVSYPTVWEWVCGLVDEAMGKRMKKKGLQSGVEREIPSNSSGKLYQMVPLAAAMAGGSESSKVEDKSDAVEGMYVSASDAKPSLKLSEPQHCPSSLRPGLVISSTVIGKELPQCLSDKTSNNDKPFSVIHTTPVLTTAASSTGDTPTQNKLTFETPVLGVERNPQAESVLLVEPSEGVKTKDETNSLWQEKKQSLHTDGKHIDNIDSKLLKKSLYGVVVCALRCPAYFKPIYRMATVCFELGLASVSRGLLLGPVPSVLLEQQERLVPLFVLKPNIFCNMWQIPTEEINRPGNFSTHARCNLHLLLQVLLQLSDVQSLSYLAQHLKSKPEVSRQYMRDNERVVMFKQAVRYAVLAIKSCVPDISSLSQEELIKLQTTAANMRPVVSKMDDSSQILTKELDLVTERIKEAVVPIPAEPTPAPAVAIGNNRDNASVQQPSECSTMDMAS